jgi:Fic/DOC family
MTLPSDSECAGASPLLDARALAFLHESNAIEGISCFDYNRSQPGRLQGHVAAFLHSQRLARIVLEQRQADIETPARSVGRFRSGFAPFNVGVGEYVPPSFTRVPDLMQDWMRDLRNHLVDDEPQLDARQVAAVCGELLQRFEAIHPFVDGNGRVGRLLVNYLLTYWQRPILVFKLADREEFFEAHRSKSMMQQFMRRRLEK